MSTLSDPPELPDTPEAAVAASEPLDPPALAAAEAAVGDDDIVEGVTLEPDDAPVTAAAAGRPSTNGAAHARLEDDDDDALLLVADDAAPPLPGVVLVRGCPRSGTTFVAEIINHSPQAAVMFEYSIGALARDLEPIFAYGVGHRDLRAKLTGAHRKADPTTYYNAPKAAPLVRFPVKERAGEILAAVIAASLRKHDVTLIGSKTPGNLGLADRATVEEHFERVKHVFAVRSPLSTINSMLNRRNLTRVGVDDWPIANVKEAVAEYRQSVNILLSHLDRFAPDVFVVKYEDLVHSFEETTQALGDFLEITFEFDAERSERVAAIRRKPDATRDVMDDDEVTTVYEEFGDAIERWPDLALHGTDPALGERLSDCADALKIGKNYRFGTPETGRAFLGLGWSVLQPEGVWSDDERADIFFTSPYAGDVVAYLNVSFFLPGGDTLSLRITGNGSEVFRGTCVTTETALVDATSGPVRIFSGPGPRALVCGPIRLTGSGIQRISLHVENPRSPLQAGISNDDRKLGVLLHSMVLAPA